MADVAYHYHFAASEVRAMSAQQLHFWLHELKRIHDKQREELERWR